MYVPRKFIAPSREAAQSFIVNYPFATLTGMHEGRPISAHIPIEYREYDGQTYLEGHVSVANDIKHCFDDEQDMLAVFTEAHTYISSSWYDHINVPTWNYIAIHVYGKAQVMTGEELVQSLKELVDRYEGTGEARFKMEDMPPDMLKREVRGIVGFRIKIDQIESQYKLSQNRHDKDHSNIIAELRKRQDTFSHDIANEMEKMRGH